ncbi:NADPH-dependent FMN reductase [Terrihabitans sp. B22-R8]|uniref:NADPH-dependent FMN reductase n=1 Tax=Terrihabitans sp. B22-R8 TaxID=3425128 RepID=UPI00403C9F2E
MARFNIRLVVGSARKGSINRQVGLALAKVASPDFAFDELRIDDLPLYNQDLDTDTPPESVARLRAEVKAADGFLFITPEYNRQPTPLLLNALHWASRPYGQSAWAGKPGAITGVSNSGVGTGGAQSNLRNLLGVLDIRLIGQPEAYIQLKEGMIGEDGGFADEKVRAFYTKKVRALEEWVALLSGAAKTA